MYGKINTRAVLGVHGSAHRVDRRQQARDEPKAQQNSWDLDIESILVPFASIASRFAFVCASYRKKSDPSQALINPIFGTDRTSVDFVRRRTLADSLESKQAGGHIIFRAAPRPSHLGCELVARSPFTRYAHRSPWPAWGCCAGGGCSSAAAVAPPLDASPSLTFRPSSYPIHTHTQGQLSNWVRATSRPHLIEPPPPSNRTSKQSCTTSPCWWRTMGSPPPCPSRPWRGPFR